MSLKKRYAVSAVNETLFAKAKKLAAQLNLPVISLNDTSADFILVFTQERLELRQNISHASKPIYADFLAGSIRHRYRFGGGRGQMIARAVGLQKHKYVSILDVTAGLGRDGFLLAYLGASVTMIERSPIVAALVADGLERARQESWVQQLDLNFLQIDAKEYLTQLKPNQFCDVIYLDPMFPESKKSALVKKEMRILRDIVGKDEDAEELLALALVCTRKRVVVKRARLAPYLSAQKPDFEYKGKSSRYDVYLIN